MPTNKPSLNSKCAAVEGEPRRVQEVTIARQAIARRSLLRSLLLGVAAGTVPWSRSSAQEREKVLRVGMTLSDIPQTSGQATGGAEGIRFVCDTMYDALVAWDLSHADRASSLIPGLASSWSVDPATKKVWTFKLRPGVIFHDGSAFDAHAVVWNLEKLQNPAAPQYDKRQAAQAGNYVTNIVHVEAVDDLTVNITTKTPDGTFVYAASSIYYSSPKRWEALGRDWSKFEKHPSGTGPWMFDKLVPRERLRWCASPDTGTKIEYPNATGWCCGPFRTQQPELPRFCRIRSTSSRRLRQTPFRRSKRQACN